MELWLIILIATVGGGIIGFAIACILCCVFCCIIVILIKLKKCCLPGWLDQLLV